MPSSLALHGDAAPAVGRAFAPFPQTPLSPLNKTPDKLEGMDDADTDDAIADWTEEDIVFLHWRLLQEVSRLADPDTPLEEKFDTLRWVFTERDKDDRPFSFVSCLRVVGCSPLSPIAYCGRVDAEDLRDHIRCSARRWLDQTLGRYPPWVREAIATNPAWIEAHLARNPQWINEQIKRVATQGDMFA